MRTPDPKAAQQFFLNKVSFTAGPVDVHHWLDEKQPVNIVDVRRSEHFAEAHIPGAVNLPHDKWNSLEGLVKNQTNVVYCYSQTCHLAAEAGLFFSEKGFPIMEMEGGFEAWQEMDFPVESGAKQPSMAGR